MWLHRPMACNTQTATHTTTTTLRILLMLEAMGIKALISHKTTPTTTSGMIKSIKGMLKLLAYSRGNPWTNRQAASILHYAGVTVAASPHPARAGGRKGK